MKIVKTFLMAAMALSLIACQEKLAKDRMNDEELRKYADELAHKYIITDGHVDLPFRLKIKNFRLDREYMGIPISTTEGDFDYERAKKGGLDAPFISSTRLFILHSAIGPKAFPVDYHLEGCIRPGRMACTDLLMVRHCRYRRGQGACPRQTPWRRRPARPTAIHLR